MISVVAPETQLEQSVAEPNVAENLMTVTETMPEGHHRLRSCRRLNG